MPDLTPEQTTELFDAARVHSEIEWSFIEQRVGAAALVKFAEDAEKFQLTPSSTYLVDESGAIAEAGAAFNIRSHELLGNVHGYRLEAANALSVCLKNGFMFDDGGEVALYAALVNGQAVLSKRRWRLKHPSMEKDNATLPITNQDPPVFVELAARLPAVNAQLATEVGAD